MSQQCLKVPHPSDRLIAHISSDHVIIGVRSPRPATRAADKCSDERLIPSPGNRNCRRRLGMRAMIGLNRPGFLGDPLV